MAEINSVTLVGRITREPELKYTQGGMAVLKFSLALNKRTKTGEQWGDVAHYFDCTMLGKGAESVSKYMAKGKQVAIIGELSQNRWEKDGKTQSKVEILVHTLQLLGGKQEGDTTGHEVSKGEDGYTDDIPF
jgi:single-strand DNA-binding protein